MCLEVPMLKLKSLSFTGIGRFTSLQTVNLEDKSNLIQVNGINNNTGGSSGSGKSTVFHALDYLLGINETPATALQNRKQKDSIYVSAIFDKDGKLFRIERSKKKGLCLFTINQDAEDPIVTGSTKVAEEKLDEVLGLPKELCSKLIHKRQSEGGFFLNLRPKEIYEFLAKCLDLQHYNNKILELTQKSKQFDQDLITITSKKNGVLSSLEGLQHTKTTLIKPEEPILNDNVCVALDSFKYELKQQDTKYKEELEIFSLTQPKQEFWEPDRSVINLKQQELDKVRSDFNTSQSLYHQQKMAMVKKQAELQTKLNSTLSQKKDEDRLRKEIEVLKNDINTLNSCTCPTCTQTWVGDGQKKKIEDKMTEAKSKALKLKEILDNLSTVDEQQQVIDKLTLVVSNLKNPEEESFITKIYELEKQVKDLQKELDKQSSLHSEKQQFEWGEYNKGLATLKQNYELSVKELKDSIQQAELTVKENALKKQSYLNNLKFYEGQVLNLQNQEKSLNEQIIKLDNDFSGIVRKKDVYLEAARCIKSYLFSVFQDSLDYIGNRATSMLSKVPNTSGCVLYFETGKENKDGTIKEEITPYINLEGDTNIPLGTLCGGERAAIDLAVDLAVNDLIECRRGGGFDWIVLDEPFNGLDAIGKEACLELLSGEEINRRIVIVDHGSELKEMVSDKIMVERTGEESIIGG